MNLYSTPWLCLCFTITLLILVCRQSSFFSPRSLKIDSSQLRIITNQLEILGCKQQKLNLATLRKEVAEDVVGMAQHWQKKLKNQALEWIRSRQPPGSEGLSGECPQVPGFITSPVVFNPSLKYIAQLRLGAGRCLGSCFTKKVPVGPIVILQQEQVDAGG